MGARKRGPSTPGLFLLKNGKLVDDPILRQKSVTLDRAAGGDRHLAARRIAALEQRRRMPGGDLERLGPVPGGSNWVPLGPAAVYPFGAHVVSGRITSICIPSSSPSTIYLGTARGGVWKTTNGGATWAPKSDDEVSLAIGALTVDPTNPLVLYAGTGEGNLYGIFGAPAAQDSYYGSGLLKSTNGGDSWTLLGSAEFGGFAFWRIAIHPSAPSRVWVATSAGLFRSDNGGTSWTQMTNGLPPPVPVSTDGAVTDVAIDPTNPSAVFAGVAGHGLWRSDDANATSPLWTQVGGGLPATSNRVTIGIAPSSPLRMYVVMKFHFMTSADGGSSWTPIPLPLDDCNMEWYGGSIAVDPTTPDVVYFGGYTNLARVVRNPVTDVWSKDPIGSTIHPDHHAFAFDPTDHLTVYDGCDGGLFKSLNGGTTWSSSLNRGLCLLQFEFMDQHPTSGAVAFGGTQDNGTTQFRNSPVFRLVDGGDGGFIVIDPTDPHRMVHTRVGQDVLRSTLAGDSGTWTSVSAGLSGAAIFYPPLAIDPTNPNNVAWGAQQLFLDAAQGAGGWATVVPFPSADPFSALSAITYVNSGLIYGGTFKGEIFAFRKNGGTWTATAIHAAPLPQRFVWDIATLPGDPSTIIVVVSGFATGHVWRGIVSGSGAATWTDISGSGATGVPDIPTNAVVVDPLSPATFYVGTDIGVFSTNDSGSTWSNFGQGLPNTAVFDLKLHGPTRLLRAATHGRGMWERKLDVASLPDVDLFVRDHLMHTGRGPTPEGVPAAFADPLQYVFLDDPQHHWMCADIKVDALAPVGMPPVLAYQMPVSAVDFLACEALLQHRHAERGNVNRVYVQVHNRGIETAVGVSAKLLFANCSAGVPPLPGDFWTAFPSDSSDTSVWHPIGSSKTASVSPTRPTVLEWDWTTPIGQATHSCLLVVIDCPQNPIPAGNKILDVDNLVKIEKRSGLKNLHVVDAPPPPPGKKMIMAIATIEFHASAGSKSTRRTIEVQRVGEERGSIALIMPRGVVPEIDAALATRAAAQPLRVVKPSRAVLDAVKRQIGPNLGRLDISRAYALPARARTARLLVTIPEEGFRAVTVFEAEHVRDAPPPRFQVMQRDGEEIVGGSLFVLRCRSGG